MTKPDDTRSLIEEAENWLSKRESRLGAERPFADVELVRCLAAALEAASKENEKLHADAEAVRAVEEWKAGNPETRQILSTSNGWGAWELPEPGADWDADGKLVTVCASLVSLGRALLARRQEEA